MLPRNYMWQNSAPIHVKKFQQTKGRNKTFMENLKLTSCLLVKDWIFPLRTESVNI
jgi:hypothetical protein